MPLAVSSLLKTLRAALALVLLFTLLLGGVYPALVTAVAQGLFPGAAHGSLIVKNNQAIGSGLIGQEFTQDKYFWGRLSATTPPYNAGASGASNVSPRNPALLEAAKGRIDALRKADPDNKNPVPIDLVTASASGLDPHISPQAAYFQVSRVAHTRGLSEKAVRALVEKNIAPKQLGIFGQARVNVLVLNLALDEGLEVNRP